MTEAGTSLAGMMTLDQCWSVSETWYAGRLAMNYQRMPLEHFQSLLREVGLVGDAWSLDTAIGPAARGLSIEDVARVGVLGLLGEREVDVHRGERLGR